jgi:cell division protein FtsW
MNLINKLFKGDIVVWIVFLFLCIISLIEVYSATSTLAYSDRTTYGPILRHATFLLLGAAAIVVMHNIHYKYTTILGIVLFFVALFMLIMTPFIGVRLNNAARWISLFGIQFQPSEFAKLALIIFTSFVLSKTQRSEDGLNKAFWIILIFTGVFAGLIITENLSTALMLCVVIYIMMFLGRVNTKKMLILGAIVIASALMLLLALKVINNIPGLPRWETWQNRIYGTELGISDPGFKITDENYQASHANIAIANGTFIGKLPGNSTQRDFLPQAYSDFIYAIIIEETGWFGMIIVPFLYFVLLYRALKIARKCVKVYPMLLVMGSALMVCFQAFVNMMVAVGAGPVTGQPMPLVSRGGTSTLITCIYFGIILSVSRFGNPEAEKIDQEKTGEIEVTDQAMETSSEFGV